MQRVRKIIEKGGVIVLEVDEHADLRSGGSNAMYLFEYFEYGQIMHDAAIGTAIRERADEIFYGPAESATEEVTPDGADRAG